jgi:hypothetical protein
MVAALLVRAATSPTQPEDLWQWFSENVTVQGSLNIAGLTLLVILFSRDLILTKGQHERRVADLNTSHAAELKAKDDRYNDVVAEKDARLADMVAEKDERYREMKESRNYYRDARLNEQSRVREVTEQLVESNKGLQVAARALGALEAAVPHAGGA